ncbi:hypothetical protein N0V90_002198 [Kalmusia sp. IMI 367209]|nr:hypothetical protein N0V90_002198 [Kalmusia sp. IMI 367209]
MSVCLCSFRALLRSRTPNSKTLTPFLYQTATIQQRQPISRRNASSRPRPEYDVPFESEDLPATVDEVKASRKTTITGSERAAFEKLYKKFNKPETQDWSDYEVDQIADEYYEDDDDNSNKNNDASDMSIDSLFDAVFSGKTPKQADLPRPQPRRKTQDLATLAADILQPELNKAKEKSRKEAAAKQSRIREIRDAEKQRVRALLEAATTDKELWDILEKDVFGVIRSMDLDGQRGKGISSLKWSYKHLPRQLSRLAPSLSTSSQLSRILDAPPTPSATASLYKILIRTAWLQNHSYIQICALLQDMDNGGIEYDNGVATLLDAIIAEYALAQKQKLGSGMRAVLGLELFSEGIQRLIAWRSAIKKRLGIFGEERKQQGKLIRKARTRIRGMQVMRGPEDGLTMREMGRPGVASEDDDIPLVDERLEGQSARIESPRVEERSEVSNRDVKKLLQDTVETSPSTPETSEIAKKAEEQFV